jgi:hypothetical protein
VAFVFLRMPPDAFSAIWDDPARYEQLSAAARQYSQRRDISRDAIVGSFLTFLNAHQSKERR